MIHCPTSHLSWIVPVTLRSTFDNWWNDVHFLPTATSLNTFIRSPSSPSIRSCCLGREPNTRSYMKFVAKSVFRRRCRSSVDVTPISFLPQKSIRFDDFRLESWISFVYCQAKTRTGCSKREVTCAILTRIRSCRVVCLLRSCRTRARRLGGRNSRRVHDSK